MQEPLVKWSRTGKVGLKYFSRFLAESECKNLKSLCFKWKDIGAEGILYFGEAIKSGHIPNLEILDLNEGSIGDRGMEILCSSFIYSKHEGPGLKELNLNGNQISDHGMQCFWEMLNAGRNNQLVKLNLNSIFFNLYR